jgi:predicted aspartyl protease
MSTNKSSNEWLVDSGCTYHITYDRDLFKELNKTSISTITVANGEQVAVEGIGTISIKIHGCMKQISNVLYVPGINQNLLSVAQLLEEGYKVIFEYKSCVLKDQNNKKVITSKMKVNKFILDLMKNDHIEDHEDSNNLKKLIQLKRSVGRRQQQQQKIFQLNKPSNEWLIDSGCTNHMTYDRELFKKLNKTSISTAMVANGEQTVVEGIGTISIKNHACMTQISNVLYVPGINQSVLSVAQLSEKGYKVIFEYKSCVIKDQNNKKVITSEMKDNKFILDLMKNDDIEDHEDSGALKEFRLRRSVERQQQQKIFQLKSQVGNNTKICSQGRGSRNKKQIRK